MNTEDYIKNSEKVVAKSSAYDGKEALSNEKKGTIACTTNRLVFIRKKKAIDVSLSAVNSVEYKLPSYPEENLNYGVIGLAIGMIFHLFSNEMPLGIGEEIGLLAIGASILIFLIGFLFRRRVLQLHTPNKTYTFATKDSSVEQVVHAVRGYEQK
jgi:hypothetical protein